MLRDNQYNESDIYMRDDGLRFYGTSINKAQFYIDTFSTKIKTMHS